MSKLSEKIFGEKKRFLTAIPMIALLLLAIAFNSPLLIWALLGVCFFVGFLESLKLYKLEPSILLISSGIACWVLAYFNSSPLTSGVFVAMFLAGFLSYKQSIHPKSILPFLYPTLPFLSLYALYIDKGISSVTWLIITVAATDIGAYFGGRVFGRTPFSPTSPKKTLEGVGVGVSAGIVAGTIAGIGPANGFLFSLLTTSIVAIVSVFGDLFESYLKREAGVKDSGKILPGHGGILDRFDGILFGAVGMYFLLCFVWKQ
ncbi:phosphatidate cytidylyltransferase [Helicobacter brantae]|uniref:Phosphatidate cytidylyltransferase n=1 Tax=Helicobacter brantae TaxID=375927 RepID=A0A3D8J046_9HELI|nr:phosphatidate cytidylyltransferase [Helicobacter brantae]RDU70899.1 hypothetical protein CQA58_03740 [Helicobacter brantae]